MSTRLCGLFALALLAGLAACGGGGGNSTSSSSTKSTAQSVSANGAVLPNDSTEAASVAVAAAKAAVAAGPASLTVPVSCPGGSGTARYTVTGPPATLANGALDTGETFSITFTDCKSAVGAAPVNGTMTLLVNNGPANLAVTTSATNLSVTLPLRTVTLNGSSALTQTVTTSGSDVTTSNRWTSTGIHVDSRRSTGGTSRYDLSKVDYTRNNIVAVNGTPVGSSCEGHSTLDAQLAFFSWFITLATLGPINYGPTGVVVSGTWLIELPDDRITLSVSSGSVSILVDLGANGSIDLSLNFLVDPFFDEAG